MVISVAFKDLDRQDVLKMFKKRDFIAVVFLIYSILMILYYANRDKVVSSRFCNYKSACVRFCCNDVDLCSSKTIKKHFNESLVPLYEAMDLKFLLGKPSCSTLKPIEEEWKFEEDGGITSLKNYKYFYDSDQYCLASRNDTESDGFKWDMLICDYTSGLAAMLHSFLMGAAAIFILATIVVYILTKTLSTLQGKIEFMFVLGFFVIHLTYPWRNRDIFRNLELILPIVMLLAALMTAFWKNVLVFDIWLTFKHQKAPSNETKRFMFYCIYTSLLTVVFLSAIFGGNHSQLIKEILAALSVFFTVTCIADAVLLIMTGVKILKISKALSAADHTWFETERDRFWTYLICCLIVSVLWPIELAFQTNVFGTFLISFSAFLIFVNFAWKKFMILLKLNDPKTNPQI